MNKNGNWRIKNSDEELPQDIQDALNEAMNTYQNENGETLKEAFDKEAALEKDDGSGDAERKLTKEEMDGFVPKFLNKIRKEEEWLNLSDIGYQHRGYYRKPFTRENQKGMLQNDKYIYVQGDKLTKWAEDNFDEGFLISINAYDYPDEILSHCEHIPLYICGIDGDEFKESLNVVYKDRIKIIVIDGEEQEILQGYLKGDGSNILYS